MLSLDEPLDLKLPKGHINEQNKDSKSLPTLTFQVNAKTVGLPQIADPETADIVSASPASPNIGNVSIKCKTNHNPLTLT